MQLARQVLTLDGRYASIPLLQILAGSGLDARKLSDAQNGELSAAIRAYVAFNRWKQGSRIAPHPMLEYHLSALTETVHRDCAEFDPGLEKPDLAAGAQHAQQVFSFTEINQDDPPWISANSWVVDGNSISTTAEGGFEIDLETSKLKRFDHPPLEFGLVLDNYLVGASDYRERSADGNWQKIAGWPRADLYGARRSVGDLAYLLWSAPAHYGKLLEPGDPQSDPEEVARRLESKFYRFDPATGKVDRLLDQKKFPFLSLGFGQDTDLLRLGSGRLVVTSVEKTDHHALQRVYVADSPQNESFTERLSVSPDLLLVPAGESDQLWMFRSRPDSRGNLFDWESPLPDLMMIYNAATDKTESALRLERHVWEPEENWLIGPPATSKWELPVELAEPAIDELMGWQIFEKDGHPCLFVRRQRLGYDDRPRFYLYHFSKTGQISSPIEIHLPLPEDPEKKNYRHSFEPRIYAAEDYLAIADGYGIWKIEWAKVK